MNEIDIIKIAINSSENLSKEKRDECIEYINNLQQENAQLKDKNKKAIEKLEFYNSGEALWYVPIQEIIDILKEN